MSLHFNLLRRHLIVFVGTLAMTLSLWADGQSPVAISSVAHLPAAVKARMPRAGTTRFYGVVPKLGPQKQDVLIHFYSVLLEPAEQKTQPAVYSEDHDYIVRPAETETMKCTIDLFTRSGSKRSPKLRLLNSLHFSNWTLMVTRGDQVSAALLWLVPKTKQTPVINLTLSSSGAMYLQSQHDVLLVFTKGLQRPPIEATFYSGAESESSEFASFESLDERGMMTVSTYSSHYVVDQPTEESRGVLYWNGQGFDPNISERK